MADFILVLHNTWEAWPGLDIFEILLVLYEELPVILMHKNWYSFMLNNFGNLIFVKQPAVFIPYENINMQPASFFPEQVWLAWMKITNGSKVQISLDIFYSSLILAPQSPLFNYMHSFACQSIFPSYYI